MYKRIVVPLDGSKIGEAALSYVIELAESLIPNVKVEIILLQVISDLTYDFRTDDVAAQLPYAENDLKNIKKESQGYLDEIAKRLQAKGLIVTTMISEGHTAEEIKKAAQQKKADLIAMSTHGRSGFRRWALGSVTDKVLQDSGDIPVLIIRAEQQK
jgi:nucleotide-binding universal stress UspA family protein